MSVNSKMTAIADKIRTLLGINGTMSLDAMSDNLQSANNEVNTQSSVIAQIEAALEGKAAAGGSAGVTIGTATNKPTDNSTSISFTGLTAEPKMFAICPTGNITLGSTRYVTSVMCDGDTVHGTYGYRSSSTGTSYYSSSYFRYTYDNNGTLTVTTTSSTNGGNFTSTATYLLIYAV